MRVLLYRNSKYIGDFELADVSNVSIGWQFRDEWVAELGYLFVEPGAYVDHQSFWMLSAMGFVKIVSPGSCIVTSSGFYLIHEIGMLEVIRMMLKESPKFKYHHRAIELIKKLQMSELPEFLVHRHAHVREVARATLELRRSKVDET